MRKNWSRYAWKLLWLVGLIALLFLHFNLELKVKNYVAITFQSLPMFWFISTAPFVLGIYISLLFVKVRSFKWNWPLILCITVPSLIIAFYNPIIYTIVINVASDSNSFSVPIPFWMFKINTYGILSLVAGLTLMVGMFERYGEQK